MRHSNEYMSNVHNDSANVFVNTVEERESSLKRRRLENDRAEQFGLAFGTAWRTFQQN